MNTPGVGNRKRKFKQLLGWGNERARAKQPSKKRTKLSRKLRPRRVDSSKNKVPNVSRRKSRRAKLKR